MHTKLIAFAALAGGALAAPSSQFPFAAAVRNRLTDLEEAWGGLHRSVDRWAAEGVRKFDEITHEGLNYELVQHTEFPLHSLRVKEPKAALCDSSSKQYSGYLDIADDAHLFYWFFEARHEPENKPLVLWINGGPGCSSTTGLLFELGPCSVSNGGLNTTYNPHSWTESANVIFLDSPVQVGYSYGSKTVSNSQDTAEDIYAFFQLFYEKFPKFKDVELHISGESYAGTYLPNIASTIHQHNKNKPTPSSLHLPLTSVLIGNGLTDAAVQFGSVPGWSCSAAGAPDGNPYGPIFDESTCRSMESKVPTCQRLTKFCYNNPSRFTCVPATLSCWQVDAPIQSSGLNPYDIRRKCDRNGEDGPLCYKQMQWIETYMNQPDVRKELGASPDRTFESCNGQVNQAFQFQGDVAHNTAALIPPLLEDGIRFLIYAGDADFMCNSKGNLAWTLALPWSKQDKYNKSKLVSFKTKDGKKAGTTRAVTTDGGAGLLRFLEIEGAGHMVPYDQPEASLDFFTRWIANESFE
ncbi:hypothetical protein JCM6882_005300 [Rhodosporidiobolus microsporus]